MFNFVCRYNSVGNSGVRKLALKRGKVVSTKHSFKSGSALNVKDLQKRLLKKRTFAKVQWAVKAYQEWSKVRMEDVVITMP